MRAGPGSLSTVSTKPSVGSAGSTRSNARGVAPSSRSDSTPGAWRVTISRRTAVYPVSVMTENAGHSGPSHLLAASLAAGDQPRVLKHADTFGVFDQHGDVTAGGLGEEGLYDEGTRFLSLLTLEIEGARPFYLDSAVAPDNDLLTITLTNPDLVTANGVRLPLATIHLALTRFLWRRTMYQQARITNYYHERVDLALGWHFAADYTDIYDVRGPRRQTRGADLSRLSERSESRWATTAATASGD